MGATLDQFDTVDFSDNDVRKLDGFPQLPRLKCLLLNNNRIVYVQQQIVSFSIINYLIFNIRRIADDLYESLPNLESIILTGNNIQGQLKSVFFILFMALKNICFSELGDLEPLAMLPNLTTLSLLTNPVSTKQHYREYVIFK